MLTRFMRRKSPAPAATGPNLALNQARALEARFPALRMLDLPLNEVTADAVLDLYNAYVPAVYPAARGAHLRTLLTRLRANCPAAAAAAALAIARSDLGDGLPDRAQVLRDDPADRDELARQTAALERHYGATLITETWPGADRGAALLHYLRHHAHLIAGKDVLHVAPEAAARDWIAATAAAYRTLDGTPGGVDFVADLTNTGLPGDAFDVVICHRVFEHVLDDRAAMSELHRLLHPGGLLNLSVPQAAHREHTAEWAIPDASHHGHVRHYGRDLVDRLTAAGFSVTVEPWLLNRPRAELLALSAYPMRMFNARRH